VRKKLIARMAFGTGAGVDILVIKTAMGAAHLLILPDRSDETRHY